MPVTLPNPVTRTALLSALNELLQQSPDGDAGAPGISFADDQTTGLIRNADSSISIVVAGNVVLTIGSGGLSPPVWQNWAPVLSFGGFSAGQLTGTTTAAYFVWGGVCFWWATISLVFKGDSTGQAAIAGLPVTAQGNGLFAAQVVSVTGIASNGAPITGVVQGNTITLYKGQNAGDPSQILTDADFENAASISLQGSFPVSNP
ncbi:hypothetical protein HLH33_02505 [Gluconacetobacter diazotrophicus]|uniref:Uncharacterized protein n=1 Tax=Gluconacetobacter diazotrophicus TaxID=33996 RepID=A0A7W4FCT1_GLUDI|nr:hypothetical protein [Gluconacetobacter diazotrophicus]MBB2155189.1 hypothetical protein [Gluconacetobacter diazotrophicus]